MPTARAPIPRRALVDEVAARVREDILAGTLGPGMRVTVSRLAAELGVSHIPIREALRRLEAEALVTTHPNVGTTVAEVRLEELHEVHALRRLIEVDTVERAAERYSDEDQVRIRSLLDAMVVADPTDPDGEFWSMHADFHHALLAPALDGWRTRVLGLLSQSTERYRRLSVLVFGSMETAHDDHRALVAAAEARDGDGLGQLLHRHLVATEESITAGYRARGLA